MTDNLTDNAKAILLLCGRFGSDDDEQTAPLNIREYDDLANWLWSKGWRPSDLLLEEKQEALDEAFAPVEPGRMRALLKQGGAMALAVENWTNKGLWVLCRSDGQYPSRLKRHLKRQAPPILFGVGNLELLELGGVAVAGSRDVDAEGGEFARRLGQCAAEAGMQLVSGAARGVDELAMHGAFSAGGKVTGVMADSLLKAAVSGKYREGIREGRLLLVSPYNPIAGFSIGNAMGRNKIIYAMADCAVVVSSGFREGGTWAGAKEELERPGGRPVFVRSGPGVPKGNEELLKMGGRPLTGDELREKGLRWIVQETAVLEPETEPAMEQSMEVESTATAETIIKNPTYEEPSTIRESVDEYSSAAVYNAVKPLIVEALVKPQSLEELAEALHVRKTQLEDWIDQLQKEGIVEIRVIRKSKKLALRQSTGDLGI